MFCLRGCLLDLVFVSTYALPLLVFDIFPPSSLPDIFGYSVYPCSWGIFPVIWSLSLTSYLLLLLVNNPVLSPDFALLPLLGICLLCFWFRFILMSYLVVFRFWYLVLPHPRFPCTLWSYQGAAHGGCLINSNRFGFLTLLILDSYCFPTVASRIWQIVFM